MLFMTRILTSVGAALGSAIRRDRELVIQVSLVLGFSFPRTYSDRPFLYFTVHGPLQITGKSRDKRVTIQATRTSICGTQMLGSSTFLSIL